LGAVVTADRDVRPPSSALGAGDCEAWRAGALGQPTNALTSLGLVGAGAWVAGRARRSPAGSRWRPTAYGALLALTGVGSVAYHGPGGRTSHRLHDASLYALVTTTVTAELAARVDRRRIPRPAGATPTGRSRTVVAAGLVTAPLAYLLGRTSSPVCRPTSCWQWHGVWHLLVAVTAAAWAEDRLLRAGRLGLDHGDRR
jgi:hypothetical protein